MRPPNSPPTQGSRRGPGHGFPPPQMGGPPTSPTFGIGPVSVPINPTPVYNPLSYGYPYWLMLNCSPAPLSTVTYTYYYEDVNYTDYPPDYYPYYDNGYYDGGYSSGASYNNVQPATTDTQPDSANTNTAQLQYENWVADQLGVTGYQRRNSPKSWTNWCPCVRPMC